MSFDAETETLKASRPKRRRHWQWGAKGCGVWGGAVPSPLGLGSEPPENFRIFHLKWRAFVRPQRLLVGYRDHVCWPSEADKLKRKWANFSTLEISLIYYFRKKKTNIFCYVEHTINGTHCANAFRNESAHLHTIALLLPGKWDNEIL